MRVGKSAQHFRRIVRSFGRFTRRSAGITGTWPKTVKWDGVGGIIESDRREKMRQKPDQFDAYVGYSPLQLDDALAIETTHDLSGGYCFDCISEFVDNLISCGGRLKCGGWPEHRQVFLCSGDTCENMNFVSVTHRYVRESKKGGAPSSTNDNRTAVQLFWLPEP